MNMGDMAIGAIATHEMFISYVNAGFTRAEALQITIALITNAQTIAAMDNKGESQ